MMTFWQVDEHTLTSRQDCKCGGSVVSVWLCSLPLMGFGDARNVSVGEAKGTFRMGEGRKEERRQARRPPILPRGARVLVYFYLERQSTCVSSFHLGPQACSRPRLRLFDSSAIYSLQPVGLTVGSVRHALVYIGVHTCKPLFMDGGAAR